MISSSKNGKDFPGRKLLQELVLKSIITDNKPDGPQLWATEKVTATAAGIIPKCNMQVTVASISAIIPAGNGDGTFLLQLQSIEALQRDIHGLPYYLL